MKNKKIITLIIIAFAAGMLFAGSSAFIYKKNKQLIKKIFYKIKEARINSIKMAGQPLLICGFEERSDLLKWETLNAQVQISEEHATSGKYSLKAEFLPSSEASSVAINKYFDKAKELSVWEKYETLNIDIFNPSAEKERIILQIKDASGNKVKTNIWLEPKNTNRIEVDIRKLWDNLNPAKIKQFNLFLWNNRKNKVFFIDNVMFLPKAAYGKKGVDINSAEFLPKESKAVYQTGDYFSFDAMPWRKTNPATNQTFIQIPLRLSKLNSVVDMPYQGSIPFAKGELFDAQNAELVNEQGIAIPCQLKILSYWPDKSIKWLLLNFNSTDINQYYLRYATYIKRAASISGLSVTDNSAEITVNTGVIQFSINKNKFYLFNKAWLDKNSDGKYSDDEIISTGADLILAHKNKEYLSSLDDRYNLSVEEKGPFKAVIKAEGWFTSADKEKFCRFIVRISAFAGASYLKIEHTFVYTGYPENKLHYLYEGKRLPENETISSISIKIPLKIMEGSNFRFAADNQLIQEELKERVSFYQYSYNAYKILRASQDIGSGTKLDGWLDLTNDGYGLALGVKNFWQQFPKGFEIDKGSQCLFVKLWPKEAGELDLKTTDTAYGPDAVARGSAFGLAKTHELFFYFHRGNEEPAQVKNTADALLSDLLVSAEPEWISQTKAIGKIPAFENKLIPAEEFLSRLFDWGARQIKDFNWYGMIDFGDTLSWHRDSDSDKTYRQPGWHPVGRWGWFNGEATGTHTGALLQFLRTQDYKYFEFGSNLSRHIMDIDTCHYNTVINDNRLRGKISDNYSQPGSMHRHNGNHWGGRNEETSHTNITGLMLYYYITGNERARDVIDEVGDFFLKERITYFKHSDIAPQRSIANILWGDVLLYELTGDMKYKSAADKLANLFYIGQKHDGSWTENYNPVKKIWEGRNEISFTEGYTLPALIAYHQLTGNKAIAESIIKATDYVIANEEYAVYTDASAYCYWLTGNKKYSDNIRERIDFYLRHQRRGGSGLEDGMIYQKAYYARLVEYLYKIPFGMATLKQTLN